MALWLHAMLCVAVPAAWGLLMYLAFSRIDRARAERAPAKKLPPVDYSI